MKLKGWGWQIFITGLVLLVIVLNLDTTVSSEGSQRVYNIGLMNQQQNYLILSIAIVFVGVVLLVLERSEAKKSLLQSQRQTRACPYCAEEILAQAIVCRHCNRDVPALATSNNTHEEVGGAGKRGVADTENTSASKSIASEGMPMQDSAGRSIDESAAVNAEMENFYQLDSLKLRWKRLSSGMKLIVVVVSISLVALAILSSGDNRELEKDTAAQSEINDDGFIDIGTFEANLVPEGDGHGYLRVSISLKLSNPELREKIEAFKPEIDSKINLLLSGKKASEVSSPAGKEALADEIKKVIEAVLREEKNAEEGVVASSGVTPSTTSHRSGVEEVLFTSIIVQ